MFHELPDFTMEIVEVPSQYYENAVRELQMLLQAVTTGEGREVETSRIEDGIGSLRVWGMNVT